MSKYAVTSVDYVTPTILGLTLERQQSEKPFTFLPGQYADISFVKHGRPSAARCFSIASSPTQQDVLEFGIRIAGKFTTALIGLQQGDTVLVGGPYGSFTFDSHLQQQIVMCSGGIGITPFMSMMRYATQLRLENELTLVCSARSQNDIPYFSELCKMSDDNPHLKLAFVLDSGETNLIPPRHKIFMGRISAEALQDVVSNGFSKQAFFICGPPPFMKGVSSILSGQGVDRERIITEAFSQGNHKQTGKSRGWPFNIYVMGAVGALASSVVVMSSDLLKSIPPTLLPITLSSDPQASSSRAQDLDALVNGLQLQLAANAKSPAVLAAEKESADAQAKADEINAQNAALSGGSYVATSSGSSSSAASSSSSTPTQAAPAPTPVRVPVCTTSSTGKKTCI